MDFLKAKQKQVVAEHALAIFFPQRQKKQNRREFQLYAVKTFAMCTKYHSTDQCPSLVALKSMFKEFEEDLEPAYLMTQQR